MNTPIELHKKVITDYFSVESVQEMDRVKNITRIIQNTENEL